LLVRQSFLQHELASRVEPPPPPPSLHCVLLPPSVSSLSYLSAPDVVSCLPLASPMSFSNSPEWPVCHGGQTSRGISISPTVCAVLFIRNPDLLPCLVMTTKKISYCLMYHLIRRQSQSNC